MQISVNTVTMIFKQKANFSSKCWSKLPHKKCCGSGMFIPDPDIFPFRILDPTNNNPSIVFKIAPSEHDFLNF